MTTIHDGALEQAWLNYVAGSTCKAEAVRLHIGEPRISIYFTTRHGAAFAQIKRERIAGKLINARKHRRYVPGQFVPTATLDPEGKATQRLAALREEVAVATGYQRRSGESLEATEREAMMARIGERWHGAIARDP